jgi:Flp pilus assembly protein TadG
MGVVVEIARLWQARIQLENALEAAALATVQHWGDHGGMAQNIPAAMSVGKVYALANTIHETPVDLDNREILPRAVCAFGTATSHGTSYTFQPAPETTAQFAVVMQAEAKVRSLFGLLFARVFPHPKVTAATAAFYDPSTPSATPRLIRVDVGMPLRH